jgi:hypothetical protein
MVEGMDAVELRKLSYAYGNVTAVEDVSLAAGRLGAMPQVGGLLPTHAYADMSWGVAFGGAPSTADVVTLAVWLVVFGALAVFGFRRSVRSLAAL